MSGFLPDAIQRNPKSFRSRLKKKPGQPGQPGSCEEALSLSRVQI